MSQENPNSNGNKPDFSVYVSTEPKKEGDKAFYTKIGAAWNVAKGGISIQLEANPLDGKMVLFPPKAEENKA